MNPEKYMEILRMEDILESGDSCSRQKPYGDLHKTRKVLPRLEIANRVINNNVHFDRSIVKKRLQKKLKAKNGNFVTDE